MLKLRLREMRGKAVFLSLYSWLSLLEAVVVCNNTKQEPFSKLFNTKVWRKHEYKFKNNQVISHCIKIFVGIYFVLIPYILILICYIIKIDVFITLILCQ